MISFQNLNIRNISFLFSKFLQIIIHFARSHLTEPMPVKKTSSSLITGNSFSVVMKFSCLCFYLRKHEKFLFTNQCLINLLLSFSTWKIQFIENVFLELRSLKIISRQNSMKFKWLSNKSRRLGQILDEQSTCSARENKVNHDHA